MDYYSQGIHNLYLESDNKNEDIYEPNEIKHLKYWLKSKFNLTHLQINNIVNKKINNIIIDSKNNDIEPYCSNNINMVNVVNKKDINQIDFPESYIRYNKLLNINSDNI